MTTELTVTDVINKSMFLLGAGASFDAKCKLSSHMLQDLELKVMNKDDDTFNNPEREALKFLLACLEYHSKWRTLETAGSFRFQPNIEELALLIRRINNREHFLPYPITGNWADKLVSLEAEFQNTDKYKHEHLTLFESLGNIIKCKLLPTWLKPESYDFLDPLKDFFQHYPTDNFRLDIFSLNNDMVIENYFKEDRNMPWRGFVSDNWVGLEDESFDGDFGRINLYKLHGSLDWVRLQTGEFKEEAKLSEQDKENIEPGHAPYIIFGQGTKTFSVEPFFSLVEHLKKKLKEKYYIFVIGYSFFDPYINNLLFDAMRQESKKLIIVNPDLGPQKLGYNAEKDDETLKIKYPDGLSNLTLATYLQDIQKNSFYSELPEFNIRQINAECLELLPVKTNEFLSHYFKNGGEVFIKVVSEYEKLRINDEEPFT